VETTRRKVGAGSFGNLHYTQRLSGHSGAVWVAKFSQDGRYLATGGQDAVLRVWAAHLSEGLELAPAPADMAAAAAPADTATAVAAAAAGGGGGGAFGALPASVAAEHRCSSPEPGSGASSPSAAAAGRRAFEAFDPAPR
jgi:hypothetical protein